MTSIGDIKTSLEKAKSFISEQEKSIFLSKKQAESLKKEIGEKISELPKPTQIRLRQQLYAGLEGRKRLRAVGEVKAKLESGIKDIESYEQEISEYEKDVLEPYKSSVAETERKIAEYEGHQEALKLAKKVFYEGKNPMILEGNKLAREYYRKMINDESFLKEKQDKLLKERQDKAIEDAIKSMEEEAKMSFGQRLREDIEKQLRETGTAQVKIPSVEVSAQQVRDLPREVVLKETPKLTNINKLTGFVLAYSPAGGILQQIQSKPTEKEDLEQKKEPFFEPITRFLKSDVVVPTPFFPEKPFSTSREILEPLKTGKFGLTGKVVSEFIPETTGELALTAGVGAAGAGVIGRVPAVIIGTTITGLGALSAINPNLPPEKRIAGGIVALVPSGGRIIKSAVTTPTLESFKKGIISIPLREIKTPEVYEIQRPVNIFGKEDVLATYKIYREVSPPRLVIKDTGKGFLFSEEVYKKPRVEIITAPPQLASKGILTYSKMGSGETGKINIVGGNFWEARPTEAPYISSLPPTRKFLWKQMSELETSGRPVAEGWIHKMLNKNKEFSEGYLEQFELGKYKYYPYKQPRLEANLFEKAMKGEAITRFEVASQLEKLKEGRGYNIFGGELLFKDVTKPLARATGETPLMKEKILFIKEPLVIGENKNIKIIAGGTKKSSNEFIKSLYSEPIQTPKPILEVSKTPKYKISKELVEKPKNIKKEKVSLEKSGLQRLQRSSRFWGIPGESNLFNPIYSTISGSSYNLLHSVIPKEQFPGGINSLIIKGRSSPILQTQEEIGSSERIKTITPIAKVETLKKSLEIEKSIEKQKPAIKQIERPLIKSIPTQTSVPKQISRQATGQLIKQAERVAGLTEQIGKKVHLDKIIDTKRIRQGQRRIISIPFIKKELIGVKKKEKAVGEEFKVFGRRYGVDRLLGQFRTEEEAKKELKGFMMKGLGASGFIEKSGKRLNVVLGKGFRKSKVEPNRIVQEREFRLGTIGERKEIKETRSKKMEKLKWI